MCCCGKCNQVANIMNTSSLAGKVIRAPSLKRGKNGEASLGEKVKLERVLGLTVSSNAALDCDPDTELVVYPAGCTVVLFNPIKNRQSHLLNSSRKTITCLALSPDGHYLVTGECGHLPLVRVWDLHEEGSPGVQVAELPSHKYGINCVAFSPSNKYVVSVGSQHDMIVNVWDWKTNLKVASNKVSTKVKAVSFAENGSYFVTVGNRHVKFWYLEYSRSSKIKEAVPLMGRSAILGEQRNNYFCDVACGHGKTGDSTYAITKSGLLCEFNNRRLLDKWVELRTTSANCIALGENFIFIGCAEGIVRCFTPSTLQFVTTLPRTHYLGVDVAQGLSISHMAVHPMNAKYPDAIALAYDPQNCKLTCIYNDHSMYIWDVRDIKRVGKSYSFLFHSACIWGVDMYPVLEDNTTSAMPHGCFITCSSDDTIRVWNLDPSLPLLNETLYKRNIYSTDLMKVLYVDADLTYLKDLDTSVAGTADKNDSSYDSRNGVRSLRISPDGKHLASGDRAGNIRIHHLITLQELCRIEAHDAEVLCLEYSRPESGHRLLASASRDRLIHIFNVDEEYNFVQTLDDHSSSITAVKFLHSAQQLQMVSCGADKSIIFRQLQSTPGGSQIQFSRGHNVAGKTTLYDMEVDSGQKHILTACQDRSIRVYNVNTGKHSKSFKGSVSEDGSLIKVVLDNSGIYAATSCTDKTLCIYDYYSGECMATMYGHSELVTGLKFTNDCRKLISASGDGCIFVWKVPHDMVVTMHARLNQQAARLGKKLLQSSSISLEKEYLVDPPAELLDPNSTPNDPANYRFTLTQLPFWAKKQMSEHTSPPLSLSNKQRDLPRGRWAQRLDTGEIKVKSVYDNDSVIQMPGNQEKKHDSDGSKDSSIDSGTELRNYMEVRQEGITSKQSVREITELPRNRHFTDDSSIGSYKYEDIESTEHDGDVEDYSEGEGESTEPEQVHFPQVYYPPAEETGSDYTVNAMDVEELRRSQRRLRKNQRPEKLTELPLISVSASVSGSQDSEDDDEDALTPSAETGERNLLSMLSISTESLDFVGKREKFLKNTFESLSGTEVDADRNNDTGGTSISSQFLVRTSQNINYLTTPFARNVAVINATKQTRSDNETSSKREELQRRIEETRRKLQSVGYRSNLKSSQSISDLSRIPEKDFRNHHGVNLAHRYTTSGAGSDDCVEGSSGSLRRACSLSDIANPTPRRILHDTLSQVSGRMVSKSTSNTRTLSRHGTKQAASVNSVNIKRSTSMGVLNQSDSESDISLIQRPTASLRVTGIMRPTISSQNKITVNQNKLNTTAIINRRRGISSAYSSVNISQVGSNEDSSSEETSPGGGKPAHSIRPRSTSADRLILGASSSLSTTVIQPQPPPRYSRDPIRFVTQRLAASKSKPTPAARHGHLESGHQEFPCKDSDILFKPLSLHLCTSVADQLTRTAENVVQLRKRISTEGDTVSESQKHNMVKALEEAINEAQHTLQLVAMPTNTSDQSTDPTLAIKLQELYSMVQQRMNQSSL